MAAIIDLNSDLGESFGAWKMGMDEEVMNHISSSNIACGWHGGDAEVMLRTVRAAKVRNVAVGAHPGYPDLLGFGRRNMSCTPNELYAYTIYQVGALLGICASEGVEMQHVKPHGAMYNQAAKDPKLASAITRAVKSLSGGLILMGLAGSAFEEAAVEQGVPFASEAFADRGYMADGSLVPRSQPGAFIHDPDEAAVRILKLVREGTVETPDGQTLKLKAHTICMHGDNPSAVKMAEVVKCTLEKNGVSIKNLRVILS
ncbi:MAG: 5-oxoprolinase subunit PxpA [Synergistaceae bacterium]|nr:5-oxoprolinase subunit PxpA [Synergistaceae bacterium]